MFSSAKAMSEQIVFEKSQAEKEAERKAEEKKRRKPLFRRSQPAGVSEVYERKCPNCGVRLPIRVRRVLTDIKKIEQGVYTTIPEIEGYIDAEKEREIQRLQAKIRELMGKTMHQGEITMEDMKQKPAESVVETMVKRAYDADPSSQPVQES